MRTGPGKLNATDKNDDQVIGADEVWENYQWSEFFIFHFQCQCRVDITRVFYRNIRGKSVNYEYLLQILFQKI